MQADLELLGGEEEGGRHQRRLLLQGLLLRLPAALVERVAVSGLASE